MRLDNKVAVITGGGSGIGGAIGRAFAQEGSVVAITDVRSEAVQEIAAGIARLSGRVGAWVLMCQTDRQWSKRQTRLKSSWGRLIFG